MGYESSAIVPPGIEICLPVLPNAEKLQFDILAVRSVPSEPTWLNAFQTDKAPVPGRCHGLHLPCLFCPHGPAANERRRSHKSSLSLCHHDAETIERQESPPRLPCRGLRPPLSHLSRQAFCLLQSPAPSHAR